MANELNTIRTTELQPLNASEVVDILVNSTDDAGRITLNNFLSLINNSSDWYSITSKPFEDMDLAYFSTKTSDEGFNVLTLNENTQNLLDNINSISSLTSGLSTRVTTLESASHTHSNKEVIDLFAITEEDKLIWNGAEVGYKLTPATQESLGGVKPDGETITIDKDGTIHGANTYELPVATANSLGGVKVDGDSIGISENGTIFAVPKGLDFQAIAAAMTGGTSNGIEITANEELEVFNFNVTKTPEIAIDNEGYWTVDGNRGTNPTKAQGEKGDTGTVEINADCAVLYATLSVDGWGDTAPYSQTVAVEGITENHVPIVDISYSGDTSLWEQEEKNYSYLTKVETNNGTITAICLKYKPEQNFSIKLKISGDLTAENTVSKNDFNTTIGNINSILETVTGTIE